MTTSPIIAMYYGGLWGLYNDGRFTGWPTAEDPYAPLQTYGSSPLLVLTQAPPGRPRKAHVMVP